MIKKLRRRVTLLSLLALLALLVVIVTGINLLNYSSVVHKADQMLLMLSGNKGHFPKGDIPPKKNLLDLSPEVPYETRYFTIVLDAGGKTVSANMEFIAAVDLDQAASMARSVQQRTASNGFCKDYRYQKSEKDGYTIIIFLDMGRKLDYFRNFLCVSILISLCGYMAEALIIWLISPKIIHPIVESYEKQKRFITDAGHELKTPLTIIHADADVLAMEIGENEWLDDIKKQARHLAELTGDLVYLAKLEEGSPNMVLLEFPISDVVEEAADSFRAPSRSQNKTLTLHIEPLLSYRGVEKDVRQLTSILLDNALKYSPEGSSVVLELNKQGKYLHLSCSNRCATSLTPHDARQLFDRFYRKDPSRNSSTGGHGLGLSIAQAIMTAHGGKLQAAVQEDILTITASFPA